MMGGISAPPELAAAWTPAALSDLKPALRISGMVKAPQAAVLATALPDNVPISPALRTPTFAGPPAEFQNVRVATSMINVVAPVSSSSAPRTTNRNT